jgi:hypoxanthine phosphoribosyltransferase
MIGEKMEEKFFAGRQDVSEAEKSWKLLISQTELDEATARLAEQIEAHFSPEEELLLVGILKGCVYFFVDLTRKLRIPHAVYFLEASSYKDGRTQDDSVDLTTAIVPSKFSGKKVLLVDELFDHGKTLHSVRQYLLQHPSLELKEEDVSTCVLMEKRKSDREYPLPDFIGLNDLPDVWLVGYGLDDRQTKRNWPHVFAVPKPSDACATEDELLFQDTTEGEEFYDDVRRRIQSQVKMESPDSCRLLRRARNSLRGASTLSFVVETKDIFFGDREIDYLEDVQMENFS